jgi:hypothetical protein
MGKPKNPTEISDGEISKDQFYFRGLHKQWEEIISVTEPYHFDGPPAPTSIAWLINSAQVKESESEIVLIANV